MNVAPGVEWEAERAELLARIETLRDGCEWGMTMLKAIVNQAGGEVLLRKETTITSGRLEVTQGGDVTYVRCWKGMTNERTQIPELC